MESMKKMLLLLFCCMQAVHAATLDEDYAQMKPLMEMLAVQSGASVNLLSPYVEQGNSVAQYLLGAIYEEGRVVTQNNQKAFELYSMAAVKNPLAALKKADMMITATGTEYNLYQAVQIYQSLLKDQNVGTQAQQRLAFIQEITQQTHYLQQLEEMALAGDIVAQKALAEYTYQNDNLIGAYVWLSIILEEISEEDKKQEMTQLLNNLQGQMTLSEITHAEKELSELKPTIIKKHAK